MTAPLVDPVIAAAAKLLQCLEDTLTAAEVPVCRVALVPGTTSPADVCCDCGTGEGQATVRVAQVYPTANFPQPLAIGLPQPCAVTGLAVVLEMCVYRCAHVMEEGGDPPTAEETTSDAIAASRDGLLMRRAARCCFAVDELDDTDPNVVIGSWQPIEPGGGCHGGTVLVTALVNDCAC